MDINVPNDVINTVCDSLNASKRSLKWLLEHGIPEGVVSCDKKEILQNQLDDIDEALRVFEYLVE